LLIAWLACYGGICNQPPQLHYFVDLTNVSFRLGGLDCRDQSRTRSRLFDCWDFHLETVKYLLTVKTWLVKLSRSRLLIETMSKIEILGFLDCWDVGFERVKKFLDCWDLDFETVKNFLSVEIYFLNYQDLESRSRPCQDKSRPPCLVSFYFFVGLTNVTFHFFVCLTLSKLTTQSRLPKVGQENKPEYYF
jgi:hypothetical protein